MISKEATCWTLALSALTLFAFGCGQSHLPNQAKTNESKKAEEVDAHGWWCREHGIPEKECAQCDADLAKKLKDKGDWCDKHERPESQCFVCKPELKEEFAKKYRAKFGKEPPPIGNEEKK
jgi:hypothetical protein